MLSNGDKLSLGGDPNDVETVNGIECKPVFGHLEFVKDDADHNDDKNSNDKNMDGMTLKNINEYLRMINEKSQAYEQRLSYVNNIVEDLYCKSQQHQFQMNANEQLNQKFSTNDSKKGIYKSDQEMLLDESNKLAIF